MKQKLLILFAGMVLGAVIFGGSALASSEVMARLSTQIFYVDGQGVSFDTCTFGGTNYVKLRDIGEAAGFEVYWDGTVQIKTGQPYTGLPPAETAQAAQTGLDLNVNMEIRKEMIQLINQVRRENGVPELVVSEALMNTAQNCAAKGLTNHNPQYECETAIIYGYPHGISSNLTWFVGSFSGTLAEHAVSNWVNSPNHFRTMITERYDYLGVGVAEIGGKTICYMIAGDDSAYNPYG